MDSFMGLPIGVALILTALGIIAGLFIPLRPFVRGKIHFTIRPNDEVMLKKDAEILSETIPYRERDALIGFCNTLRKIGLTLIIK